MSPIVTLKEVIFYDASVFCFHVIKSVSLPVCYPPLGLGHKAQCPQEERRCFMAEFHNLGNVDHSLLVGGQGEGLSCVL